MIDRDILVKKIENLPSYLLEEVANYIDSIQSAKHNKNQYKVKDITLASEESLSEDWLKPEEEDAWKDL